MKKFLQNALVVACLSAIMLAVTFPSVKPLWAQSAAQLYITTPTGTHIPALGTSGGILQTESTAGGINATFSQVSVTVTSGVTALSAADTDQKYWQVQNNHATGNIYVAPFSPVSSTNGVKIGPGQAYAPLIAPKDAMYGIGDVASNTAVIVTTGK